MPYLIQVQNPRYRKLPGDFRARQTACEGPREGAGPGSSANPDRKIGHVAEHLGARLGEEAGVTTEFQFWFYHFLGWFPLVHSI